MKFNRIISAVAAAALALSMSAVNAFAETVTLDSGYTGDWSKTTGIQKDAFDAIEGDVKVVLNLKVKSYDNSLVKPMNVDKSWDSIVDSLTSDTAVAKVDGFFCIPKGTTTLEFVVSKSVSDELWGSGLAFQVNNVTVLSAELSEGTKQGAIRKLTDAQAANYISGMSYEEATAPVVEETTAPVDEPAAAVSETSVSKPKEDKPAAEVKEDKPANTDKTAEVKNDDKPAKTADKAETAPAAIAEGNDDSAAAAPTIIADAPTADSTATTPVKTGNTAAAVIVSVMAVAGIAAVASKKRK